MIAKITYIRMMDSGEIADLVCNADGECAKTLRQKDWIPNEALENGDVPKKQVLRDESFRLINRGVQIFLYASVFLFVFISPWIDSRYCYHLDFQTSERRVFIMERKTPLYDEHVRLGGKIVPFAGYLLPVQYESGVMAEHTAVRTKAGLFDVSHMGEVLLTGKDALLNLQRLVTADCSNMQNGQARYSPMCNEEGGVVDDVIVYRFDDQTYFIVINASNRFKDMEWMRTHLLGEVCLEDVSDQYAQIAIQGPLSHKILSKIADDSAIPGKYYTCIPRASVGCIPCMVSQTGYTGETGYELYCDPSDAQKLWSLLLETGREEGLLPCGLGARDTLRLEAAMPLFGHELTDSISPLEASLDFAVSMGKGDFIGKTALLKMGAPQRRRVGLRALGKGIAREHCPLQYDGRIVGETTSGTFGPSVGCAIAMALVDTAFAQTGTLLSAQVRGKTLDMQVVDLPFYKKQK